MSETADLVPGSISITGAAVTDNVVTGNVATDNVVIEATYEVRSDGGVLGSLLHVHRLTPAGPDVVAGRPEWSAYDGDHRHVGDFDCLHAALDAVASSRLVHA